MPHPLQFESEDPMVRVEDYLDRVVAPLVDDVPHQRRRELRAELGAHLDALVEAHLELGATPEQAVDEALRQFGSPRQVGRQWLREWRRVDSLPPASVRQSALVGFLCFLPASFCAWMANNVALTFGNATVGALLLINTVAFPVAAGLITGLLARKRHAYGALLGCGMVAIICAVTGALQAPSDLADSRQFPWAALAALQTLFWLPLAAAAGAFGGSMRHWVRQAIRGWAGEVLLRWAAD